MDNKKGILIAIICFLTGVVFGFCLAPMKQGIGNNCGNTTNQYYNKENETTETTDSSDDEDIRI